MALRAEQEIGVNDAEEAQDQVKVPRQAEGPVCVQPVKRDHHQPAQQRAQKAVAAVAHALAPEAAQAEHRADAGEAGVAPAQQPVCRTDQQHGAQCFEDAHAHLRQRREMKNACCCLLPFCGARAVAQRRKAVFLFEQP